jgi:sec-independent protein translocase protein TatB
VFGISATEFVILLAVAAVVLGPERLPQYAQQLARLIRELRRMAQGATEQIRSEMGPEFDNVDWRKLDPRQYDPRRIVRDALAESIDLDDPLGLKAEKPRSAGGPTEADRPPVPQGRDVDERGDDERRDDSQAAPRAASVNDPPEREDEAGPQPPWDPDAT